MSDGHILNGFRRIEAAVAGEWPDRRPVMLHNSMHATREAGLRMQDYYSSGANAARVHREAVERYGLDGIMLDIDAAVLAEAVGVPVDHPQDLPPRVLRPMEGTLAEVADRPQPDLAASPRVQVWLEAASRLREYFGDEVYLRGNCGQAPFSLASMIRGPEQWMLDLVVSEAAAFRLLDYCLEVSLQFVRLMIGQGVHMISNGDRPAGPDVMISPLMFRRFARPYQERLCAFAHENGLPYLMHICGKTDGILRDFSEMGLDAVELDYKTDEHAVHDALAGDVTLFGNLDPTGVLTHGTPQYVEDVVLDLLQLYADSPRLVLNAGCAIPPVAPPENIRRMVYVAHNFPVGE